MHIRIADTETTNAKDDAKVVEIGWMTIDLDFNILEKVESLIDPQAPISPSASGIHGLVYADVASSPTIEEFFSLPECYGKRLPGPAVFVGHRISFDTRFFKPFVDGEIIEVDTLRWARAVYPNIDDHKLSTLMYALDLPRTGSHRVMADIETAYWLLRHLCEATGRTLADFIERSQQPLPVHQVPFGKHKGESMDQVPPSYCQWALRNMDLDFDLKHAFEVRAGKKQQ